MSLTVICGPPAGGKTTWAMERAKAHDIIIDFDRLAVALAGPGADTHQHPKPLRDVTFRARAGAILAALQLANEVDVYLIHAQPNDRAMEQYAAAGAKVVTIDPGRAVVEQRCREERPPGMLSVVGRWYSWHAKQGAAPAAEPEQPVLREQQAAPVTSRAW